MPNYSLTADTAAYTSDAAAAGNAIHAAPYGFALSFPDVALTRNYDVAIGALDLSRLSRLSSMVAVVDPKTGRPTQKFQYDVQRAFKAIEDSFNRLSASVDAIQAAYDAAAQANTAAVEAKAAAEDVRETVTTVETKMNQLEAGTLVLPKVNVGGQVFVNNGGSLTVDTA